MNKPKFPAIERRYVSGDVCIEQRAEGEKSRTVWGYALKFNLLSKDLGGFRERILPEAMEGVDMSDVVALFNHDKNMILARNTSKTLTLKVDEIGFRYQFEAPETTAGNDLLVSISRGDISGSSFAFTIDYENVGDRFEKDASGVWIRSIVKFKRIIDVSPVVFPAYTDADVYRRSVEEWTNTQPSVFKNLEVTRTMIEMKRK